MFKTEFKNYHMIYNKYYISQIIDIAYETNVKMEPDTSNDFPVIPKEGELPMETILNQYNTFDESRHHLSFKNLMFIEQIINNNPKYP